MGCNTGNGNGLRERAWVPRPIPEPFTATIGFGIGALGVWLERRRHVPAASRWCARSGILLGADDRQRRVHEPDVRERLREVPQELTGGGVDLF